MPANSVAGNPLSDDELEDLRNLEKLKIHRASLNVLIGQLVPADSWNKDLEIYGQMDGDRIDVSYEGGIVSELMVRIDVRSVDKGLIQRLAGFAEHNQLAIIDLEKWVPIGAHARSLLAAILNSNAREFAIDPETFLEGFTAAKH